MIESRGFHACTIISSKARRREGTYYTLFVIMNIPANIWALVLTHFASPSFLAVLYQFCGSSTDFIAVSWYVPVVQYFMVVAKFKECKACN